MPQIPFSTTNTSINIETPRTPSEVPYPDIQTMPFPFQQLPPELRNKIYGYSLVTGDDKPLRYKYKRRDKSRTWRPLKNHKPANVGLLGVSKQVNAEATKIFYNGNKFLLEHFSPHFTTALRPAYCLDIKSVVVKLNLARSSSYKQQVEETLAFRLPVLKNLTNITFDLEGRDLPQDPRIEDQILACIRSFQKLQRIDIKGTQYTLHPGDIQVKRDWRFTQLVRSALSLRWVEWVDGNKATRVTFKKWEGPMPNTFKEWAPGKGRVDPAWGNKGRLFVNRALDETSDFSCWKSSVERRALLVCGAGGVVMMLENVQVTMIPDDVFT